MSVVSTAEAVYLVLAMEIRESKKKTPYASLMLRSGEGDLQGRIWESGIHLCQNVAVGDVVKVVGQLQIYNGVRQVIIEAIERVPDPSPYMPQFAPRPQVDPDESLAKIRGLMDKIADPGLRGLLNRVFVSDEGMIERLKRGWGGASVHHAWPGGLLAHLAEVGALVDSAAQHLADLDREVALTGALIHDLSKMGEYVYDPAQGKVLVAEETALLGHVHQAVAFVYQLLEQCSDLGADVKKHLLHIVASHHETIEWGALAQPHTPEAALVATMDRLSAHLCIMKQARDATVGNVRFTPHEPHLGSRVWIPTK
ncbi:MAG: HD domain-containing protein [Bacillota bacterium]